MAFDFGDLVRELPVFLTLMYSTYVCVWSALSYTLRCCTFYCTDKFYVGVHEGGGPPVFASCDAPMHLPPHTTYISRITITHSHGSTSVLMATKQVSGKCQNWSLAMLKPLTDFHKNWQSWLRHGRHATCEIL